MSDIVTALNGASFEGVVAVQEAGPTGMISLRGDLGSVKLAKALNAAVKLDVPNAGATVTNNAARVCWMSPDELLILLPHTDARAALTKIQKALKSEHHLATNVSDARAMFRVSGQNVRDVVGKLTPADVSMESFGTGQLRRSRMAQVAAAFWMPDAENFEVVCFRSEADYVFGLLKQAATPGSEVHFHHGDA